MLTSGTVGSRPPPTRSDQNGGAKNGGHGTGSATAAAATEAAVPSPPTSAMSSAMNLVIWGAATLVPSKGTTEPLCDPAASTPCSTRESSLATTASGQRGGGPPLRRLAPAAVYLA